MQRHGSSSFTTSSPRTRRRNSTLATNKTMEDRHTVSEPRPVKKNANDRPCWEVDILRDDTVIVDTFFLDSDVLPPRINKKGKLLWKLPDTGDKVVRLIISRIKCAASVTIFLQQHLFLLTRRCLVSGSLRLDQKIAGVSWIFSGNERRNANRRKRS